MHDDRRWRCSTSRRTPVPRDGSGRGLHRRGDDAVPVRADADRRRLRPNRWWKPFGDNASRRSSAGVGFGVLLIAGIGNVSVAGFTGLAQANASGNVEGLAALIFTVPVGVRTDQRAADHRGARRHGAGPPRTLRAPKDPARTGRRAVRPAGTRRRCPIPVCTPGTTPSTSAALLPDGSDPRLSVQCDPADPRPFADQRTASGDDAMNPRQLPVPVGAAVHDRRGRSAVAAQRHRHVHVRRADAQRRPTSRSSRSPACTVISTVRSWRSSPWWSPPARSSSVWRSS